MEIEYCYEDAINDATRLYRAENATKDARNDDLRLRVVSWNARSMNCLKKIKLLQCLEADIFLLQEIWHPIHGFEELVGDDRLLKVRNGEQAGGTLVAWKDSTLFPSKHSAGINKDSFINKYMVSSDRFIWMASIYISEGTKENFMLMMSRIQELVPEYEWPYLLLCGDWNINVRLLDAPRETIALKGIQQYKRALMVRMFVSKWG